MATFKIYYYKDDYGAVYIPRYGWPTIIFYNEALSDSKYMIKYFAFCSEDPNSLACRDVVECINDTPEVEDLRFAWPLSEGIEPLDPYLQKSLAYRRADFKPCTDDELLQMKLTYKINKSIKDHIIKNTNLPELKAFIQSLQEI